MFDLGNVDQIAEIGYDAALNAFNSIIEDNKFDLLVKTVKQIDLRRISGIKSSHKDN